MRQAGRRVNMLSFIYKPLCISALLFGLFGLVWLRSNIVSTSYEIRALEEKRMEELKDAKLLMADQARMVSLEKIEVSSREASASGVRNSGGLVFPDRIKVIHVKKGGSPEPYRASYGAGGSTVN